MSLFKKNPNEAVFTGGEKHWTDVIKNTGFGELLIWRQPEEDFNTNSTLIVMPGEEAIFIKGGTIEQTFDKGTYILSTENYPFISRLRNAFSGGISAFNCVVYFVRKSVSAEIPWGTDSPIQVRDKVWNVRTDAKARGAYKIRIEQPAIFLEKLVGNNIAFQSQDDLKKYFQNEFQGKIKASVSKYLNSLERELIGIDECLDELSDKVEPYIDEALSEYGLKCVKFSLSGLDIDQSKYDAIDKSQIEYIATQRAYQGDKAGLEILGADWKPVKEMEILKDLANNPGAGGATAGAGLGLGIGAAGAFASIAQQTFTPMNTGFIQPMQPKSQSVPQSAETAQARSETNIEDPLKVLVKLKEMLDAGVIEQEDYDEKKAEILSRM